MCCDWIGPLSLPATGPLVLRDGRFIVFFSLHTVLVARSRRALFGAVVCVHFSSSSSSIFLRIKTEIRTAKVFVHVVQGTGLSGTGLRCDLILLRKVVTYVSAFRRQRCVTPHCGWKRLSSNWTEISWFEISIVNLLVRSVVRTVAKCLQLGALRLSSADWHFKIWQTLLT